MKVLVTGATGFVGNAVVHRLVREGHSVRCLVRPSSDTRPLSDIVWEKAVGDVTSQDDCRMAVRGMEAVVHCAACVTDYGPWKRFRQINVDGSCNLAEAALGNKVSRFVYLSTNDVLGVVTDRVIDDTLHYKRTGFQYPDTKIEAEQKLFDLFRLRGLPLVALRPAWVYGPGDRTFLPEIVDAMAGGYMIYFGGRTNVIYLNFIDNLMDAMILAITHDRAIGRAYIVTDGVPTSWEDLCTRLAQGLNLRLPRFSLSFGLSYGAALGLETCWSLLRIKERPFLTRYAVTMMSSNMRYDDSRIRQELGFSTQVPVDEGLSRTIAWLKTQPIGQLKTK